MFLLIWEKSDISEKSELLSDSEKERLEEPDYDVWKDEAELTALFMS